MSIRRTIVLVGLLTAAVTGAANLLAQTPPAPASDRPAGDTLTTPPSEPAPLPPEPRRETTLVIAVAPEPERPCPDEYEEPMTYKAGNRIGYWFFLGEDWPSAAPDGALMLSPRWTAAGSAGALDVGLNLGVGDFNQAAYLLELFTFEPRFTFPPELVHGTAGFGFTIFGVDTLQDRPVYSLLNPRLTWGLHVVLDRASFGLDGQFGYLLRLGDIPNITFVAASLSASVHIDAD